MNYRTVEEAKAALLGRVVRMSLDDHGERVGVVANVMTFADYSGSEFSRADMRPVVILKPGGSWFADDGDWEVATG